MVNENDLEEILAQELERIKECGGRINLAEIERRTGISRAILRRWQKNGYAVQPSRKGWRAGKSKLNDVAEAVDSLLGKGVSNSSVILGQIRKLGYDGGISILKDYIHQHRDLVPAPRHLEISGRSRGMRYSTDPGDCYQMDWGFVNVMDMAGNEWRCACFAMVCHHCGFRHVEFFPNARQENLFIGMIHAFSVMGIPKRVLTDNMKSVIIGRDAAGNVIYNNDYDVFQRLLGFRTELCKVAHPFTKGAVERLVRYVKENFIQGREFLNVSELNAEAFRWCMEKNGLVLRERQCIPANEHAIEKAELAQILDPKPLLPYLAPERSISFDGFVEYEGRRFGVPYTYTGRKARVMRRGDELMILTSDGGLLQRYGVDWSMTSKTCPGQWAPMPEEIPTAPVKATVHIAGHKTDSRFSRFSFRKEAD